MGYYSQVTDINAFCRLVRYSILLAGAIYRKPALLILDEATSNLDHESETQVIDYIATIPVQRLLSIIEDYELQIKSCI